MKRRRVFHAALATTLVLQGCASQKLQGYASEKPPLDLRDYFIGTLDAWGIFQDRSGQVVRRFTVVMNCQWEGAHGTLDEHFNYSDGTTQQRTWHLTRHDNGRYTGTAGDVIGEAEGQTSGNAFHWNYTLRLPVGDTTYDVQLDDWMYLVDERVMLNRTRMSKFGVRLGDLTLSFTRRSA